MKILRLVQDLHGIDDYKGVEGWLSPLIEERPYDELRVIADQLPERTISLRWFAVDLYQALLDRLKDDNKVDEERAILLTKLGEHLSGLRRWRDALEYSRAALTIWEDLINMDWDRFAAGLATGLHNFGKRVDRVGSHQEGLRAIQRAVNIRKKLAEKDPGSVHT